MDTVTTSDRQWVTAADAAISLKMGIMVEWPAADTAMAKPTTIIL
jgi:hypothetical protein